MGVIIFAFVWMVLFVVGTGYIAERKGHSFAMFAVLGLFLGFIGILIAIFIPRKQPANTPGDGDGDQPPYWPPPPGWKPRRATSSR